MAFTGSAPTNKCCGRDPEYNIPTLPQNLMIFEVMGYNYRTVPVWLDEEGQNLTHLQFSREYHELKYTWKFYNKGGLSCGGGGITDRGVGDPSVYYLSTSDDIFPTIYEKVTERKMKVERTAQHDGYTLWKVSC